MDKSPTTDSSTQNKSRGSVVPSQGTSILRFDRRLLILFFMLLIFASAARPITDPDFWWHLRTGQYILETSSIPYSDIFSTVKFGSEWVTHEWLSEVLMYWIFQLSGYGGLIAFFGLIIAVSFWITYRRCEMRAPNPYIAGLVLMLGAAATIPTWGVRPQMFSMLFASFFLWMLEKYGERKNSRSIWLLIPAMVLWVNMHAGYAVGLALILVTIVGLALDGYILEKLSVVEIWQRTRQLFVLWVVAVAAVCINPNGPRMYSYPLETLRSGAMMRYIQEWRPPDFQDPTFLALLFLIIATFCVLAVSSKQARPSELLLLCGTAAVTLRSARNVPFFALVATPILAGHLWTWISPYVAASRSLSTDTRVLTSKASLIVIFVNVVLLIIAPTTAAALRLRNATAMQSSTEARDYPTAAIEFLKTQNVTQPIYNEYHWGGYLIWRLYPQYRVFIDGRADVYGDHLMEEFFKVHDGTKSWREVLYRHQIQSVLVSPNTAIASLLRQDGDWQKVFEDEQAVVFVRRSTPTASR
jgi:hypothetical protein